MSSTEAEVLANVLRDKDVYNALIEAGVLTPGDRVRRIVIDIQVGRPVALHIERIADKRTLEAIIPGLKGIVETKPEQYHDGVDIDYDVRINGPEGGI